MIHSAWRAIGTTSCCLLRGNGRRIAFALLPLRTSLDDNTTLALQRQSVQRRQTEICLVPHGRQHNGGNEITDERRRRKPMVAGGTSDLTSVRALSLLLHHTEIMKRS